MYSSEYSNEQFFLFVKMCLTLFNNIVSFIEILQVVAKKFSKSSAADLS